MKKLIPLILLVLAGCGEEKIRETTYPENEATSSLDLTKIESLFDTLPEPVLGDWLYDHEETLQTLEDYIQSNPRVPENHWRNKIYVQPIGDFSSPKQKAIIDNVAEFLHAFFNLEVKINPPLNEKIIPKKQQRFFDHRYQWNTQYIIHQLLYPALPSDAIVMIALADHDLYPADDWNFVYGQASLQKGVGVWSYYHFGHPDYPEHTQLEFKKRILKTAGHETCHMFGIKHCVSYNCLINGSNSLYESDHNPLYLCPPCLTKLCWNLNMDPKEHMARMQKFWFKHKVFATARFYQNCLDKLD